MTFSEEERKEIVRMSVEDPTFFLTFFLPHWFRSAIPWHLQGTIAIITRQASFLKNLPDRELDKVLRHFVWEDQDKVRHPIFFREADGEIGMIVTPYTLVMMPRGASKTTTLNGLALRAICLQLQKYILYTSETQRHAETQLSNVKTELEGNWKIKAVFGTLQPAQRQGVWREGEIEATNGVYVTARGAGGQVRGQLWRGNRPDLILVDDLQDKEAVRTEEQRQKYRSWFLNDLMSAMDQRNEEATLVMLATLLHAEALAMTARNDPRFTSIVFGAHDPDGEMLWPEYMDEKKWELTKQASVRAGELTGFYMEYENILRNEETAKFRQENILHEVRRPREEYAVGMAVDPAISEKAGADFFSLAVVGMHLSTGKLWVLDSVSKKGLPFRQQVDLIFEKWKRWRPEQTGIEAQAYQKALVHSVREEMFRKHLYFEVTEIVHGRDSNKFDRVEGILQSRYASQNIIHAEKFPELEAQLIDWPNGKRDAPDAVSMAIMLLQPWAAAAADPSRDLAEDEYQPLSEVLGEWRSEVV